MEIINTNKAKITIFEDRVSKYYFIDHVCPKREYENISTIYSKFNNIPLRGWCYKAIKPIDYDEKSKVILMEKAEGKGLDSLLKEDYGYNEKAGIWLGLYHSRMGRNNGEILLFRDYNRTNIFIDEKNKKVVALDPGYNLCLNVFGFTE